MSECTFCRIIANQLPAHKIYEDDEYLAFLDIHPINPGHTLLIPKSHTDYIFDLSDAALSKLFTRARHIAKPLRQATESKRIGIMVEGFVVPHIHVHLIPIYSEHDLDPKRAKSTNRDELIGMAGHLSNAMQKIS